MKKKAILYVRVSTDEQADKGYSLQHQEERLPDRQRKHDGCEEGDELRGRFEASEAVHED